MLPGRMETKAMTKQSMVLAGAAAIVAVAAILGFPAKESRAGLVASSGAPASEALATIQLGADLASPAAPWAQIGAERRAVAHLAPAPSAPAFRSSGGVAAYVAAAESAVFASADLAARDAAYRN